MADRDQDNTIVFGDDDIKDFYELLDMLEDDEILKVTLEVCDD